MIWDASSVVHVFISTLATINFHFPVFFQCLGLTCLVAYCVCLPQDMDKPCDAVLQQVSIEEILEEQRLQQQAKQETEKVKMQVLKDRGLSIPKADNLDEY